MKTVDDPDYLRQEQKSGHHHSKRRRCRRSGAKKKGNLIDTTGPRGLYIEGEPVAGVLDGAVVVFDGRRGRGGTASRPNWTLADNYQVRACAS